MGRARISSLLGKVTLLIVICCLVMGSFVVNTAVALDGSGTQEEPWLIQSLEDFNDFAADANYWAGFTRLETDVNLAGQTYTKAVIAPDVSSSNYHQGTKYTGIFDGNDHKIMNLTIDDGGAGNDWLGLFGSVDNGEVRNLGLEGGSVSASGMVVGGLVGSIYGGAVSNCYSTGDVNGGGSVSDLIGIAVGGSWVSNCYSTGDVSGTGDHIGGLVGYIEGVASNCYSTGNVNGEDYVGGLVGQNNNSSISNCYSTGDVNGDVLVGGLVG
ncbi:MAG: GLUG motif-containing protein, partial [Planctomycetota bacterium]